MNRIKDYIELKKRIVDWIKDYADSNGIKSLVVGVSGGIDSAVVSTLCAETGLPTYVLTMPLLSKKEFFFKLQHVAVAQIKGVDDLDGEKFVVRPLNS